jgi:hypothetical protein
MIAIQSYQAKNEVVRSSLIKRLLLIFHILLFCFSILQSQSNNCFRAEFGFHWIPIKTERNGLTRCMIFPGIILNYKLNEIFSLSGSYLYQDIISYDYNYAVKYSEVPIIMSYEEALRFRGKMISLPKFRDYIFFGINYSIYNKGIYNINSTVSLGHRVANGTILTYVLESPSFPNGFEVHPTAYHGEGFGVNAEIIQRFNLYKLINANLVLGSYLFNTYQEFQPYAGLRVGIEF